MRRALLVGIDEYTQAPLAGCVQDAGRMKELLTLNENDSPNFACQSQLSPLPKEELRDRLKTLFARQGDVALFYFAGHGTVKNGEGFLVTEHGPASADGLPMNTVVDLANASRVSEIVIIIDCCHAGALGGAPQVGNTSVPLREGVSILSSSGATEEAVERDDGGVFTSLVCEALRGGASDVIGNVTVAGIYAFVDQALGPWDQRPLLKSHVSKLVPLRRCKPEIDFDILRLLPRYFGEATDEFPLDPSYEPSVEPHDPEHEVFFGHLQRYRAARLLTPVGEEHMFFAAMNRKSCRLTPLGQYYWKLAKNGHI